MNHRVTIETLDLFNEMAALLSVDTDPRETILPLLRIALGIAQVRRMTAVAFDLQGADQVFCTGEQGETCEQASVTAFARKLAGQTGESVYGQALLCQLDEREREVFGFTSPAFFPLICEGRLLGALWCDTPFDVAGKLELLRRLRNLMVIAFRNLFYYQLKQDQQKTLTNILDNLDANIYVSDLLTDEILFINRKMMSEFSLEHDVTGEKCWSVLQDGMEGRCSFCPSYQLSEHPEDVVVWEEHNTATHRYYKNTDSVIEWLDGRKVHVQHSVDITSEKSNLASLIEAKQAAEQASRAKSDFLSRMSHEIRTPMNAIIGLSELLMESSLSDKQKKNIRDINISASALLGIINELLDFSKIEAGKLLLAPVSFDLYEMLHNLHSMYALVAGRKGLAFSFEQQSGLPRCVFGDDTRIRQILVNILGNAIKFTGMGGVALTAGLESGQLIFAVTDTGEGIRPEDQEKIFRDFEQAESRKSKFGGTGLGLAITKNLVDMMGGTISLVSSPGQGSTFAIRLPYVPGDEGELDDVSAKNDALNLYAPTASVLVVDDVDINLNVARGLLEVYGIQCDTAASAREAMERIRFKQYDIVFMDHMMPGMDGLEATGILRSEGYDSNSLVIVALTANAIAGARELYLNAGMNDFLTKPISRAELSSILRAWLPPDKIETDMPKRTVEAQEPELLAAVRRSVPDIDIDLAMGRVGGMSNVLVSSITILAGRLSDTCDRLQAFLDADDLSGFAIEVHGVKGSLANIGAMSLSLLAEHLERASKNADRGYCQLNLPELLTQLRALAEKLKPLANPSSGAEKPAGQPELLVSALAAARDSLDRFEGDEALEQLERTALCTYGATKDRQLAEIIRLAQAYDFDQAISRIDLLLRGG